jgi:hypothetical protein
VLALAASVILRSAWPLTIWILLLLAVAARTALQNRWKRVDWTTLLLYGFHSHLQQIPIFFGQLQFLFNRNKALMEYKDLSPLPEKATPEKFEVRQP